MTPQAMEAEAERLLRHVATDRLPVDSGAVAKMLDLVRDAYEAGRQSIGGGTAVTDWCVWWGGEDPNDCAGHLGYDDEAEAREMARWFKGGQVASREVLRGRWVVPEAEGECDYCTAAADANCQGCGDPVCEAKHSVPTPEGGRLCPDCEDTAAETTVAD